MRKLNLDTVEENFFRYLMKQGSGESFNRGIVNKLHLIRQHFSDSEIISCKDIDGIVISVLGENKYRNLSWWSKKIYKKSVSDFIKFQQN